ncbi:MAG: thiol-activated cytolysin family protein, partial [Bacteroidota bacterium]
MNQQSTFNPLYLFPLMAGLALLLSSCDNEKPIIEPGPDPMTAESVEDYLQSLPSWSSFSPPGADLPSAPTGEAGQSQTDTLDVQMIQEDGSIDTLYNVVYDCQQIPYSIQQNPEDIVMYSPDREILFPGALIQGKSHKEFLGSLLGLPIAERSPIRVSIPSLPSGGNFRAIARPNQANVSAAVGEMIGNATREGLSAPSTISFKMESYHSERQMALAMGLSGKYLGFSGSASGAFSRNQSETTITVQFFQKMFEVVVEPPQTPGAFFDADFTQAKLQEQVDLGRMGPTNLPVYVSNVVYGRMMMFSLTSTASEEDIRATLQLAYSNLAGNVTANMSAKQKKIIQTAKIAITSLGGDAQA